VPSASKKAELALELALVMVSIPSSRKCPLRGGCKRPSLVWVPRSQSPHRGSALCEDLMDELPDLRRMGLNPLIEEVPSARYGTGAPLGGKICPVSIPSSRKCPLRASAARFGTSHSRTCLNPLIEEVPSASVARSGPRSGATVRVNPLIEEVPSARGWRNGTFREGLAASQSPHRGSALCETRGTCCDRVIGDASQSPHRGSALCEERRIP